MVSALDNKKETIFTSKNPWEGVLKESTGDYQPFYPEETEYNVGNDLRSRSYQSKKEFFARKTDILKQTLKGRIENIEKDFIMVGFEIPEENRREYYPIDINQIGFDIKLNEIIEMEIIRNKAESKVEINFYPYKEIEFFQKRETALRNKLKNIEDLPEDDF